MEVETFKGGKVMAEEMVTMVENRNLRAAVHDINHRVL